MKKFFRFAAIAVAAIALFSCEKPQGDDTQTPGGNEKPEQTVPEYTDDLTFTLEVVEVEADQAKIKVEHNGTTKDTWYGFATTESDVDKAIADVLAEGNVTLKKNTKTSVTVRNLGPETEYTFIAVGIKADGTTYGEPATVKFTTAAEEVPAPPTPGFTQNPAWTVEYLGAGEVDGEAYEHVISVTSTDSNPYLTSVVAKADFDELGIEVIAEGEIAYWTEYVNQFNQANGTNYDISAILYTGTISEGWDLEGGEYVALAIGVNEAGTASGKYAVSEPFSVVEEEMSPEYSAWIGNWTFTDSNGTALSVTFAPKSNNKTFNMFGYDAPELSDHPVEVQWMQDNGIWAIYPQNFGTFSFTDGSEGDIYFLGGQQGEQGFSLYTDAPACIGGMDADGNRIVIGFSDEESGINMTLMAHFVVIGGTPYFWAEPATIPMFPLAVTPEVETSSLSVEKNIARWTSKKTMLPKPFKAYDFNKSIKARF